MLPLPDRCLFWDPYRTSQNDKWQEGQRAHIPMTSQHFQCNLLSFVLPFNNTSKATYSDTANIRTGLDVGNK
jgi:hypothetical protein